MQLETNDILTAGVGQRIFDAVRSLDEQTLREEFGNALDHHGIDALVADVLVPVLRRIGEMWSAGELSVLHEHHASSIVRSVVAEFRGPAVREKRRRIILTCPPGELHDLPSHLFAAMLLQRGWAPVVLGANTPWAATSAAVHAAEADACVISGMKPSSFIARRSGLTLLARSAPVFIAGPGASLGPIPGVSVLPNDWREAANLVDARATDARLGGVAPTAADAP